MKKIFLYGGGYIILSIINSEVLSWLVLLVLAIAGLAKWLPLYWEELYHDQ